MPNMHYKGISYPTIPSVDPLQGVALPGQPSTPIWPSLPTAPYYYVKSPYRAPESNLTNYNDPLELNSLADVILTSWNPNMKRWKLGGLEKIPVLNMIPSTLQMFWNTTGKPAVEGDFKALAINNLQNLGETLDIFANPVKALAQGEGWEGVKRAIGMSPQGRFNYDYNTGNIAKDMFLEVISDPLNWVTLGLKGLATGAVKGGLRAVAQDVAKEAGQELSDKMANKMVKAAVHAYYEGDVDTMYKAFLNVADNATRRSLFIFDQELLPQDVYKAFQKAEAVMTQRMSNKILQNTQKLVSTVESIEQHLFKGALNASGIAPAWKALSLGKTFVADALTNRTLTTLQPFTKFDNTISFTDHDAAKAVWDAEYDAYNLAQKLDGEAKMSPETFNDIMRAGVYKDKAKIDELINKYWREPEKLDVELQQFLQAKHKVNTLDEYLEVIEQVNAKANSAYNDVLKYYHEQIKLLNVIKDQTAKQKIQDDIMFVRDFVDLQGDRTINKLFHEWISAESEVTEPHSIRNLLEIELDEKQMLFGFSEEDLRNRLHTALETWNSYIQEQLQLFRNEFGRRDPSGKFLKTLDEEYTPIILQFVQDMHKQIDVQMGKLMNEGLDIELDYDKVHTLEQLFNKSGTLAKTLTAALDNLPDVIRELHHVDLLKEAKENISLQSRLYDQLVVKHMRDLSKQYQVNLLDTQSVDGVKKQVAKLYAVVKQDWMEQMFAGISKEGNRVDYTRVLENLQENIQNFINTSLQDTENYNEAWLRLNRSIQELPTHFKQLLQEKQSEGARVHAKYEKFEQWFLNEKAKAMQASDKASDPIRDFYKSLDDIQTELDKVNIMKLAHPEIELEAGHILYNFKLEQTYNSLVLLSDEVVTQFITDIHTNTGPMAEWIHKMADAFKADRAKVKPEEDNPILAAGEICNNLLRLADSYKAYADFIKALNYYPMQKSTQMAFLSSIQKDATLNPGVFLSNFDYYYEQLMQSTEDYINTTHMKRRLALEDLSKTYMKDIKTKYGDYRAHHALSDIYATEVVMEKELTSQFDPEHVEYIIMDLETTGLNPKVDSLLQCSMKSYLRHDGTEVYRKVEPGDVVNLPAESMLDKFYPELPYEEQVAKYYEEYSKGLSELEMLQQVQTQLAQRLTQVPSGKSVKIVFHNGDKFDVEFLKTRMLQHNLDTSVFDQIDKLDTLKMLRKKEGYYDLAISERLAFKNLLLNYATKMEDIGNAKLIDPNNGGVAKSLMDLSELTHSIATKKTGEFDVIQDIGVEELSVNFRGYADKIYDQFQFIARANKNMQWLMLDNKFLESQEGQWFFIDFLQSQKGLTPMEIYSIYGSYLNPSKMLYSLADGVNYLGYRKAIDMNKIMEYFRFQEKDKVNVKQARALTNVARTLDKLYNKAKNPHRLQVYADKIKATLTHLQSVYMPEVTEGIRALAANAEKVKLQLEVEYKMARITKEEYDARVLQQNKVIAVMNNTTALTTNFVYMNLRTDKMDVKTNWAILQYLYSRMNHYLTENKNKAFLGHFRQVMDDIDPDVKRLLDNPEFINNAAVYNDDIAMLTKPVTPHIDDETARPADWKASVADALQSAENLKNLARVQDQNSLYRAKTQALSSAVMDTHDMLQLYEQRMNTLAFTGQQKYRQKLKNYTNHLATQQLVHTLMMPAKDLLSLMAHRAPWFEFDTRDLILGFNKAYEHVLTQFVSRETELKQLGINMVQEDTRYYIYLDKSMKLDHYVIDGEAHITLNGIDIPAPVMKDLDIDAAAKVLDDPEMIEALKKARLTIHRLAGNMDASSSTALGSLGDSVNKEFYRDLYSKLPDEVKKNMHDIKEWMHTDLFQGIRYNYTNLGTVAMRRQKNPYTYNTIVSLYHKNTETTALYAKTKVQYAQLWFQQDLSINKGWLQDATADELIKYFGANPHYVIAALVEDPKTGYRVVDIPMTNVKQVTEARRLNAIIMDYQTFSKSYETINKNAIDNDALNWWHRLIYTYKIGYLFDPGVWMRNFIDSTMKNMIETGEIRGTVNHTTTAMMLWDKYNKAVDYIIKMDRNGKFKPENVKAYFEDSKFDQTRMLDKDTFEYVHTYLMDGPSAGITGRWAKYYTMFPEAKDPDELHELWGAFVQHTRKLMTPNQWIEQIQRLAEYLALSERGLTNSEAFKKIADTHFDYGIKSKFEYGMELVFPFYTFVMRNMHYWLQVVEKHPWVLGLFRDIMTPVWNFDELSYDELSRNQSLQYQILAGNIPLMDNGLTLKVNPSFMDVYGLFTQPLESVQNKMAAPLQALTKSYMQRDYDKLSSWTRGAFNVYGSASTNLFDMGTDYVPILGTLHQRYFEMGPEYAKRTGVELAKILPGVLGATKRWEDFQTKHYLPYARDRYGYNRRFYGKKVKRPKKIWKTWAKKTWAKKTYAKKTWAKMTYYPNYYHRFNIAHNFYYDQYTATGKNRFKNAMLPLNGYSVKYRLKDLFRYTR